MALAGEMLKKSHYIVLMVVVLAVLALLQLPSGAMGKFKLAISGLLLPLFGLSTSAHELVGKTKEELVPRSELLRRTRPTPP